MSCIVLIEDNLNNARIVVKLLQRAGHEVITAEDGESGLEKVLETIPDLVLVDLGLPDVDGQTIVGMMRQQDSLKQTCIIAFTAWPEATAQEMSSAYGCDGVITKPIDTRQFANQVAAYLKPQSDQPVS
jgi:two-component system cell cycle response regulator DivK